MKIRPTDKTLMLGDLIANVYSSCDKRRAKAILNFAFQTGQAVFRGQRYVLTSGNGHRKS